jgi:hypothetical protein
VPEILNQAFVYQSEINEIIRIARQRPRIETGGDLYGTFTHGGALAIWLASGPGPAAAHHETQFSQDVAFTTESQRMMMMRFALQYIGSWHSHHVMSLRHPSPGDVTAARSYLKKHRRDTTLEIIVNHERHETVLHGYMYRRSLFSSYEFCELHELQGESPVRAVMRIEGHEPFDHSRSVAIGVRQPRRDFATHERDVVLPAALVDLFSRLVDDGYEAEYDERHGHHFLVVTAPHAAQELAFGFNVAGSELMRVGLINRQTRAYRDLTDALRAVANRDGIGDLSFDRVFPQLLEHLRPVTAGDRDR